MKLEFSVYRYNPDVDDAPHMQDYTLEAEEGRDMMLLDALMQLKEKDPTLSFRRSCREGVCGSDGLNMNGKNGLACITPISALQRPGQKIVIRPLPGLPLRFHCGAGCAYYAFPPQSQAFIFAFLRDSSAAFTGRTLSTRRLVCRCSVSMEAHYREFSRGRNRKMTEK
jgi:hypothetical protein